MLLLFMLFIIVGASVARYLVFHDRGEHEPVRVLWLAVAFGLLAAFPVVFLERQAVPASYSLITLSLTSALSLAAIEEICKFLPLALFIYKKPYFNEHTDGVIYFALVGLGFGVPENILYTAVYGTRVGLARLILTPFFHAATAALTGYFLARQKIERRSLATVFTALAAAICLHGLYDYGLGSGRPNLTLMAVAIAFGLSAALFVLYQRATLIDQTEDLSSIDKN